MNFEQPQDQDKPLKSAVELAMEKTAPKQEPEKPLPTQLEVAMRRADALVAEERKETPEPSMEDYEVPITKNVLELPIEKPKRKKGGFLNWLLGKAGQAGVKVKKDEDAEWRQAA